MASRLARRLMPVGVFLTVFTLVMLLLFSINTKALRRRHPLPSKPLNLTDFDFFGVAQNDMQLITYIREIHLQTPSSGNYLLNENKTDYSQNGQSSLVLKILKEKKNGFFVEAGAYNGEELSNTLMLEREYNWTGLLVEPDPWNYFALRKRNRKAYSINACLSPTPYPKEVTFRQADTMGHITANKQQQGLYTRVKCFPLFSILLALNKTTIDYLSLDVEGAELQILKTIPFNIVKITVMTVEFRHLQEGPEKLVHFLGNHGFRLLQEIGDDYVFVHKNYMLPEELHFSKA